MGNDSAKNLMISGVIDENTEIDLVVIGFLLPQTTQFLFLKVWCCLEISEGNTVYTGL